MSFTLLAALSACGDASSPARDVASDRRWHRRPRWGRRDRCRRRARRRRRRDVRARWRRRRPFDPDAILEVALTLGASDWEALRLQLRDPLVVVGAGCLDAPWPSPFTWFSASATIAGATYPDVGVRKKGNLTAYEVQRPALRLDFDRAVAGREVLGQDDMVLNRAVQDPSFVRTCLGYQLFAAAGLPAPRCGFAHVRVNGQDLGLYLHVERMDKDLLEDHFEDASGNLYEGSLSDFRAGWLGSFELDSGSAPTSELQAVATALDAADDALEGELAKVLDVDQFITYWAMETILEHVDGYSGNLNNFYLYHDPTRGRLVFLPYGADFILPSLVEPAAYVVPPVMGAGALARRLYAHPALRARYLAKVKELVDRLFSDGAVTALTAEVDRMAALVAPAVSDPPTFQAELEFLKASIGARRAAVQRGLDSAPSAIDEPPRDTPCLAELGHIAASFETTWGTWEMADPLATGTGSISATLGDTTLAFTDVGATAGEPGPGIPVVALRLVGDRGDGTHLVCDLQIARRDYETDRSLSLRLQETSVTLWTEAGGELTPLGQVAPGTVTLEAAGREAGDAVVLSFEGDILEPY
ncbi:MAG: CotH kinase family protein [Myxococcota bacterium]